MVAKLLVSMSRLGDKFPFIRVITLPERPDRRVEIVNQLSLMKIRLDGYNIGFLEGQISEIVGSFSSTSERGRFLAHRLAIDQARRFKFSSILILEDDIIFSLIDKEQMGLAFDNLSSVKWDIFYGGSSSVSGGASRVTLLASDAPPESAKFIALSKNAIEAASPYFNVVAGGQDAGPISTEAAYAMFRAGFPKLNAYCATPKIVRRSTSMTNQEVAKAKDNIVSITHLIEERKNRLNARIEED